jgi:hypothetical protein
MNDNMLKNPRVKTVAPSPPVSLPSMNIPLPEKMEIRVVEYTKTDNSGIERIVKVELQYRMWNYDEYGMIVDSTNWEAVERIKIDLDGDI